MIGKVIEGRYVGASICKLPEKNVLFIETEDGERIALSKKNAISIDDVTDQYPSHEGRLMLVMWNDFETSILQLGNVVSKQQTESRRERVQPSKQQDAKHKKGNLKSSKRVPVRKKNKLLWIMVALISCIIVTAFAVFILRNVQPVIQAASQSHEHSGQDASCDKIGHEGGEWVIISEATVCTPGTHARYCIRCNEVVEQSNYYKPVHQNGIYEFSANDFSARLRSILQSKDGNFDATITSASTDAINVTISVNYEPAALFFFLNDNKTVGGNENSIIKASSIMVTVVTDDTYQREIMLPAIIECCNNDMKADAATEIVDRFVSTGSYQYDDLSYTWGKYQGYDTVTIDLNAASSKTQVDPPEEVPVETAMPEQVVEYRWQEPKNLSFPLADVQITMRKVENIEGAKPAYAIEIICDSMTSKELMTFMIHSTDDWGFDRISLAERIQKVLDMYDDAWAHDTMLYCSMSGYGIEWTVSLGSDDHYCGIIGLTTNKPNEFEAVLGMMPQDASTEENTIISSDGITNWPTQESPARSANTNQDNGMPYEWNSPVTLDFPLTDVVVGMYKNSSEYWVEFTCDTMDTEDFLEFMIDNPYYWGFDRIVLAEQMAKVFKAQEKVWSEGNIGYSSMEGYGIKWVAYGDMKDDNRCVLGLKVNKLNEFEAACNAYILE